MNRNAKAPYPLAMSPSELLKVRILGSVPVALSLQVQMHHRGSGTTGGYVAYRCDITTAHLLVGRYSIRSPMAQSGAVVTCRGVYQDLSRMSGASECPRRGIYDEG